MTTDPKPAPEFWCDYCASGTDKPVGQHTQDCARPKPVTEEELAKWDRAAFIDGADDPERWPTELKAIDLRRLIAALREARAELERTQNDRDICDDAAFDASIRLAEIRAVKAEFGRGDRPGETVIPVPLLQACVEHLKRLHEVIGS